MTGTTVTLKGAGTTVITAWQAGNGNFNAALPVSQPLVVAEPTMPPVLTLSTLSDGAVTADPVLNIAGVASDSFGVASLTVNGVEILLPDLQSGAFSGAAVLAAGKNVIEVAASDSSGNRASQTLNVTLDAAAPSISLSVPADNSVTDQLSCAVTGTVTPGSMVSVSVNGSAAETLTVSDGAFTGAISLQTGINTIEVFATLSGRTSQVKRSLIVAPDHPTVAIVDPAEDLRTEQKSITISGTTAAGVSVLLQIAGMDPAQQIQGGPFQLTIPLDHIGEFSMTVLVTAPDGSVSATQRNIIRVPLILGDLNNDGVVDIRDAMAALRMSLGMDPISAQALAHGDVAPLANGVPQPDGTIDAGDVLLILRKVVGMADF